MGRLRVIAFLEGLSFIILLGIAMPLKYYFDSPAFVRIIGMGHGVLFLLFIFSLIDVMIFHRWSVLKTGGAFVASLLPFGTFVLDARVLKKEMVDKKD